MYRPLARSAVAALLAACAVAAPSAANGAPSQNLRVLTIAPSDAATLSPNVGAYTGLGRLLWAPLLAHDAQYHITAAGLATAPRVSANGRTYTFTIRRDARYSDGTPVTARDIAFDLRYDIMTAHPKIKGKRLLGNVAGRFWGNIVGAQAVFDGKVAPDEFNAAPVAGVRTPETYTLQIQLTHPDPGFIDALLIAGPSAVKPADIRRGEGKTYTNSQYWTTETGVAFSGPFALASFSANQGMTLAPNPHYYGPKPKLQTIAVTFVKTAASAVTAFQNKEADWVDIALGAADVQNARTAPYLKSTLVRGETNSVQQLFISAYKPFDDVHVRRAVYMAIDKKTLVTVLGGGPGQQLYTPLVTHVANPSACPGIARTVRPMPYDPTAAKAELAKSSYGAGVKNMPVYIGIGIFGEDTSTEKVEAQFLQQALQKNLGFTNVQIIQQQVSDFTKPPYPLQLWPNEQGNRDPDLYDFINNLAQLIPATPLPKSGPPILFTLPYVPQVRTQMQAAAAATTTQARCTALRTVLQTWVDQAVTIDLYTNVGYTLVAPWVKNLRTANGVGGLEYTYLSPGFADTYIAAH